MQTTIQPILDLALKLTEAERLEIACQLLDSVPADREEMALDDPQFVEELDRRFADEERDISLEEFRALRK